MGGILLVHPVEKTTNNIRIYMMHLFFINTHEKLNPGLYNVSHHVLELLSGKNRIIRDFVKSDLSKEKIIRITTVKKLKRDIYRNYLTCALVNPDLW
ncbi:hypothetical protein L1994_09590 [Methanomicrobium antiquum]|uniref:Uncharacterized protein n=1 Tax=Methanomicrobium antiquum TaxID=487686 RepID=A0AAF0JMF6_9EURY|nr:hypothetical protein [Methanomicrobium antiquum]WFN36386.1 hypothetical protein L1994_09590 [Methanomicrobium antiquum]